MQAVHAQYENVWAFGTNAGIDFNTSPPLSIRTGISTREGCASVCDTSGQLLFYTDGTSVWGKDHQLMMEGDDITGVGKNVTSSTAQGALIIPIPGTKAQYYVFSLASIENTRESGNLYRSVVDMSINSGQGQIVEKGKLFAEGLTEHMTAVLGNRCDIWLILSSYQELTFRSYHIDINGIDTSAVFSKRLKSSVDDDYNGFIGLMDVSPDRSKLAVSQGGVFLYDFDPDNGTMSNPYVLDGNGFFQKYGLCFSPDNTKLYVETAGLLWQYDLSSGDTNKIQASKNLLAGTYPSALKRAPDGKIYSAGERGMLCVIHDPNEYGPACNFRRNDFALFSNTNAFLGMPNVIQKVHYEYLNTVTYDTGHCVDYMLLEPHIASGVSYLWEDSSQYPVRRITQSGTYWVRYSVIDNPCLAIVDTFKVIVQLNRWNSSFQKLEVACEKDTLIVHPLEPGSDHLWDDGSISASKEVYGSGLYWVSYRNEAECNQFVDSFLVNYPVVPYEVAFSAPVYVCVGHPVTFQNTSGNVQSTFAWTFGDGGNSSLPNPVYIYPGSGSFDITLTGSLGKHCKDTMSRIVTVDSAIEVRFAAAKDSLCLGEAHEFVLSGDLVTVQQLNWDYGDGSLVQGEAARRYLHAYDRIGLHVVSLDVDFRSCPAYQTDRVVYVADLPKVFLGNDTGVCPGGRPLLLRNVWAEEDEVPLQYSWSTGATGRTISVSSPGHYTLTLSHPGLGCSSTGSISIARDCYLEIPNAFSPNGDGINDYFLPRQLLSSGVQSFELGIFDRWGARVFSGNNLEGRGWDGTLNDKEQPVGVYVYRIVLRFENGEQETYEGNLSLLR